MSNYKAEGSKVTWAMACKDMSGTGEITFKGDDVYDGQMNVTSPHAMVDEDVWQAPRRLPVVVALNVRTRAWRPARPLQRAVRRRIGTDEFL